MFIEFNYLKDYCRKDTEFKEKLIKLLKEERREKLATARASDDDEADVYYDEADDIDEIINYLIN